jgi:hypothetical protein
VVCLERVTIHSFVGAELAQWHKLCTTEQILRQGSGLVGSEVHGRDTDRKGEGSGDHCGVAGCAHAEHRSDKEPGKEEEQAASDDESGESDSGVGISTTPDAEGQDGEAAEKGNEVHTCIVRDAQQSGYPLNTLGTGGGTLKGYLTPIAAGKRVFVHG